MYRAEYPRPQLKREAWLNLNGEWDFEFDDADKGLKERWFEGNKDFQEKINVPFAFQTKLSQINNLEPHEIVWYQREFTIPEEYSDKRVILHFGAVDFVAKVFINDDYIGEHVGGSTPFSFDISNLIDESKSKQRLSVRVYDPRYDQRIPRGKQTWDAEPNAIWYTNTTGIWQTVWLEFLDKDYIKDLKFTPDIDRGRVEVKLETLAIADSLEYELKFKDTVIAIGSKAIFSDTSILNLEIYQENINRTAFHDQGMLWSPEHPNLFDIKLKLIKDEKVVDEVESYFGMRKVHYENNMLYLNNQPYFLRLALDQGYWPESLLTAPSDQAFIDDIKIAKELGFNGCRKHQKVEDPRFLYWADKLGFLVWGESASAQMFSEKSVDLITKEWKEIIKRDYNHPSIIVWVPFNESWGIINVDRNPQEQHYTETLYHLIHTLDPSRLVISNDGWELTTTDIVAVHNYQHGQIDESRKFKQFKQDIESKTGILKSLSANKNIFVDGYKYAGQPIMITEFGGTAYQLNDSQGWGYTKVNSSEEFVKEYERVINVLLNSQAIAGFCYTQLYDVEQEINGLLTYDRQAKCDPEKIRAINERFIGKRVNPQEFI